MTTRINTNTASLRGLRNLQKSSNLLGTSLERLSTGLKINSGKDNPAGLIASERMRLQITSIQQSITNSNRANNVIATADGALGEISGLLNEVRGLVQEGLNDGAISQEEKEANQLQIDAALSAINRIAANTSFAGEKLIDGTKAFNTTVTTADAAKLSDFQINEAVLQGGSSISIDAEITSIAEKARLEYAGGALSSDTTIEVGGSKGQEVLFLGSGSSLTNIASAINDVSGTTGVTASVEAGLSVSESAVAANATLTAGGGVSFTRTSSGNDATLGGSVAVRFLDTGATAPEISIETDSDNNKIVTIGIDAGTTTAANVVDAVESSTEASALVTSAVGTAGAITAGVAETKLSNGTDGGSLSFSDLRPAAAQAAGDITVVYADASASSGTSVAVAQAGDDYTITIELGDDGSNVTATLQDVYDALANDALASSIVDVDLSGDADTLTSTHAGQTVDSGSTLVLESSNYGSAEIVEINTLAGSFATTLANGTSATRDDGVDIGVTINGQTAQGKGLAASVRTSALDASISFNEANNVASTTATINVVGGGSNFQIGQDVSAAGQIGIGIEAVNTARLGGIDGKLYELGTGNGKSLLDVGSNGVDGDDLVNILEQALDRVNTLRGRLGALQKNVIETNINSLGVALENVAEARSQITDTDFATETANLTRAQILSQAGTSVLAIANQNPQQVLALLG